MSKNIKYALTKVGIASAIGVGIGIYGGVQFIRGGKQCAKEVEKILKEKYELDMKIKYDK